MNITGDNIMSVRDKLLIVIACIGIVLLLILVCVITIVTIVIAS